MTALVLVCAVGLIWGSVVLAKYIERLRDDQRRE